MTPSVRGRERRQVIAALLAAGAVSGALVGMIAGTLWTIAGLPAVSTTAAAIAVGVALAADLSMRAWRRPRPLSVRSQVPREWSNLFSPVTTALLYGARLGVGPLTILPTWLWWSATVIATTEGPAAGAAVGAVFAIVRLTVVVATSTRVQGAMVERMAALRRRERPVRRALAIAAVVAIIVAIAARSGGSGGGNAAATTTTAVTTASGSTTTSVLAATTTTATPVAPEPGDDALAAVLLSEVPAGSFALIDDPRSTGPLDTAAAASFESDDSAERDLLETRGFQRGYIRSWSDGNGGGIVAEVYRFATADGASQYETDGFITLVGFGAVEFSVNEIPGARGFAQASGDPEAGPSVYGVAFTHDDLFFLLLATAPGSGVSADDARTLAIAQAAKAGITPGG